MPLPEFADSEPGFPAVREMTAIYIRPQEWDKVVAWVLIRAFAETSRRAGTSR